MIETLTVRPFAEKRQGEENISNPTNNNQHP